MIRRAGAGLLLVVLATLAVGCGVDTERKAVLPWLLVKHTRIRFGGFDPSNQASYFVKYYGFWRGLCGVWSASVLDDEHALLQDEDGWAILSNGSLRPVPVCPKLANLTVPGVGAAIDCVEVTEHAFGGPTEIRIQRIGPSGEVLAEWPLPVTGERRIFTMPPSALAYDDAHVPYFLTMDAAAAADYRIRPTGCALVAPTDNGPRVVAGDHDMTWDTCRKKSAWEPLVGAPLREGWTRP